MKETISLIIAFLLFTSFPPAHAESKTFIKEYSYQASEDDSRNSSRTLALREVKRLLLEELGTYLESVTEVQNFQLTKDQITTLTAGIVMTEVVDDKWDGRIYWLKAKITVDSAAVIKSIDTLRKDRVKTKELEEIRKHSDALLKENERLRKELHLAKGKKRPEAEAAYDKTIKELTAIEWKENGISYVLSSQYNDAIDALSKAIELNPKEGLSYELRGVAYFALGNYKQAIADYNEAIKLDPKFARTYYGRGITYNALGNYKQAIADYNKAIKLDPKFAMAYGGRGLTYYDLGNYKQAIDDLDKALEQKSEFNALYYYFRGCAYGALGNYNMAIEDFNTAIKLNPKNAEPYFKRGLIYGTLSNYQQMIQDMEMVIKLTPKNAEAYHIRGRAYGLLGNNFLEINDAKIAARLGFKEAQDYLRKQGIDW